MASFSLSPSLHRINPIHPRKPAQQTKLAAVLPCRSHLSPPPENKESKGKEIHLRRTASMIYSKVEKLGRELKEALSPKQKGDWKDVALMSFSFAVYIYISQRIVCAYCAWISTIDKQF
ncbi:uncharacterized protein LOC110024535 [Phalaenopsis equestris]|uniref:uncharacterized protein LOC110024535 n=1 Tax=Phalaenopsis equestris TaxID=78828 RepID=UPI0009E57B6D|nr:uncharacterized protein LOC110024535 [Phalaenopsis equestris]